MRGYVRFLPLTFFKQLLLIPSDDTSVVQLKFENKLYKKKVDVDKVIPF
jgi:hypothetical protein